MGALSEKLKPGGDNLFLAFPSENTHYEVRI
jgi:hypothetical protein